MSKCLICGAHAVQLETRIDGEEQRCPECGHFAVSGSLLAIQQGRLLGVEQTRAWLQRFREANPGVLPVINTTTVYWGL